mmetsp:Transcript_38029/g.88931  ORF Transcript_38029/g.88931 Transcript_38029/m.88931 type:complete len:357 (-) Transcript_38029:96-1166(-)
MQGDNNAEEDNAPAAEGATTSAGESTDSARKQPSESMSRAIFWLSVIGGAVSILAGLPGVPWRVAPAKDEFREYFKSSRTYTLFTMSGPDSGQATSINDVAKKMCEYERTFGDVDLDVVLDEVIQQATAVGGAAGSCKSWQLCKDTVRNRCDKYNRLSSHGYWTFALLCLGNILATATAFNVCTEQEKIKRWRKLQEEAKKGSTAEEVNATLASEDDEEEDDEDDEAEGTLARIVRAIKDKKMTPFIAAKGTLKRSVGAFLSVAIALGTYVQQSRKVFGDLGLMSFYPYPDLKQGPKMALAGGALLLLATLVSYKRYRDLKPPPKPKKKKGGEETPEEQQQLEAAGAVSTGQTGEF